MGHARPQPGRDLWRQDLELELVDEFRILPRQAEAIRRLLELSFPDAEFTRTRTYLKQLPGRRLLATRHGELIGHLGLEHRIIGTSAGPASIFGLVDLCVAPRLRRQGIATELVTWVEALGAEHRTDFLLLFARDPRFYERSGFGRASNSLRWLKLHEHESIGIGEEPLEELMIKAIGTRSWPAGPVDLLG